MTIANAQALAELRPSWQDYVGQIAVAWRQYVASIIEVGRLLNEAKANIPHGVFEMMVTSKLPFSARMAQRLMAIASNPVLVKATHQEQLPPHWATLYELSTFPPAILQQKLMDGTITAKMERKDVLELKAECVPKAPTKTTLIDEQLKADPSQPNRAIAEALHTDPAFVSKRRTALVQQGAIPDIKKRTPRRTDYAAIRERIDLALRDDPRRSDRIIAKQLFVDQMTVGKRRHALEAAGTIEIIPREQRVKQPHRGPVWQARQRKAFDKNIAWICKVCEHAADLQIPPLDAEQKKQVLNQLKEALQALRTLKQRIEGGNNDSALQ